MPIFGWDASDFDWARGPMDLAAARRDGIEFFTHKATEGTKVVHQHYGEALDRARGAGIDVLGAYVVPRTPGNNGHGSIQAQVDYFLAYLDQQTPWWRTYPYFMLQVDTELWAPYDNVAPQYGVQMCDLLRARTGRFVIHYAPRWAYAETIGGTDPLWGSAYGKNPAVRLWEAYRGDGDAGWTPYSGRMPTILQFGSAVRIGSQPDCDGNAFRGTIDQLRALVAGPKPTTEVVDVLLDDPLDIPNYDGDPTLPGAPGPEHTTVGTALGVSSQRSVQSLRAIQALTGKVDALAKAVGQPVAVGAPTDAQVDAAILKAMLDPAVVNALGAAVASHIHVS